MHTIDINVGWINADTTPVTTCVRDVTVSINGHPFLIEEALVMPLARFDVILGIGWLEARQATQKFFLDKHIKLTDFLGRPAVIRPVPHIPRATSVVALVDVHKAKKLLKHGATGYICTISTVDGKLSAVELLRNIVSADCTDVPAAMDLLNEFQDVFREKATLPPLNDHAVQLKLQHGKRPVSSPPFKVTPEELKALKDFVQRLLDNGWIIPASGEWSSPVMLLTKPDGSFRMVVDYRRVNAVLQTDSWPLPRADVLTAQLATKRVYSKFDLTEGYRINCVCILTRKHRLPLRRLLVRTVGRCCRWVCTMLLQLSVGSCT